MGESIVVAAHMAGRAIRGTGYSTLDDKEAMKGLLNSSGKKLYADDDDGGGRAFG